MFTQLDRKSVMSSLFAISKRDFIASTVMPVNSESLILFSNNRPDCCRYPLMVLAGLLLTARHTATILKYAAHWISRDAVEIEGAALLALSR